MYCPLSLQTIFVNGVPSYGARVAAYDAGTTTPRALFQTSTLDPTRQHPRPLPVNAVGMFPPSYIGIGDYDLIVTDQYGAQIASILGLQGDPKPVDTGGTTLDPLRQIPTGALLFTSIPGRLPGFVRANGGSIGSAASSATERGNDDCLPLFAAYWNAGAPVVGGRGASANADFSANKVIVLPNLQNRVPLGLTDMGNAGAAASLAGGAIDGGSTVTLGGMGGEAAHTLGLGEMPAHAHPATFSGTAQPDHKHTGATSSDGVHNHGFPTASTKVGGGQGTAAQVYWQGTGGTDATVNAGLHSHTFTSDAAGGFTPAGTVSLQNTGSGAAHNNLPPFLGVMAHIKL